MFWPKANGSIALLPQWRQLRFHCGHLEPYHTFGLCVGDLRLQPSGKKPN